MSTYSTNRAKGNVMVKRFLVDYETDEGALVQGAAEFLGGEATASIFVSRADAVSYASLVPGVRVWSVEVDSGLLGLLGESS